MDIDEEVVIVELEEGQRVESMAEDSKSVRGLGSCLSHKLRGF